MQDDLVNMQSRSRKGAWIEILADQTFADECDVAPVRERGLKFVRDCYEAMSDWSLP